MVPENPATIGFQIIAIHVTSFSMLDSVEKPQDSVGFNIDLHQLFAEDSNSMKVQVKVSIGDVDTQAIITELTVECQYMLQGYTDWLKQQSELDTGRLPAGLSVTLNSISISTTRGILSERLRGTVWEPFVLPIIDPKMFQVVNPDV